ncbi:hypothetical protein [Sphingorhabdus sp. EL138]|nr:hypothetical protein [Sphingorhabdus sp. EL138]
MTQSNAAVLRVLSLVAGQRKVARTLSNAIQVHFARRIVSR